MSIWKELEKWWATIESDSKPEFEQVKADLMAEVELVKADVTGAWASARNHVQNEITKYTPEVQTLVQNFLTHLENAVLGAVEKH